MKWLRKLFFFILLILPIEAMGFQANEVLVLTANGQGLPIEEMKTNLDHPDAFFTRIGGPSWEAPTVQVVQKKILLRGINYVGTYDPKPTINSSGGVYSIKFPPNKALSYEFQAFIGESLEEVRFIIKIERVMTYLLSGTSSLNGSVTQGVFVMDELFNDGTGNADSWAQEAISLLALYTSAYSQIMDAILEEGVYADPSKITAPLFEVYLTKVGFLYHWVNMDNVDAYVQGSRTIFSMINPSDPSPPMDHIVRHEVGHIIVSRLGQKGISNYEPLEEGLAEAFVGTVPGGEAVIFSTNSSFYRWARNFFSNSATFNHTSTLIPISGVNTKTYSMGVMIRYWIVEGAKRKEISTAEAFKVLVSGLGELTTAEAITAFLDSKLTALGFKGGFREGVSSFYVSFMKGDWDPEAPADFYEDIRLSIPGGLSSPSILFSGTATENLVTLPFFGGSQIVKMVNGSTYGARITVSLPALLTQEEVAATLVVLDSDGKFVRHRVLSFSKGVANEAIAANQSGLIFITGLSGRLNTVPFDKIKITLDKAQALASDLTPQTRSSLTGGGNVTRDGRGGFFVVKPNGEAIGLTPQSQEFWYPTWRVEPLSISYPAGTITSIADITATAPGLPLLAAGKASYQDTPEMGHLSNPAIMSKIIALVGENYPGLRAGVSISGAVLNDSEWVAVGLPGYRPSKDCYPSYTAEIPPGSTICDENAQGFGRVVLINLTSGGSWLLAPPNEDDLAGNVFGSRVLLFPDESLPLAPDLLISGAGGVWNTYWNGSRFVTTKLLNGNQSNLTGFPVIEASKRFVFSGVPENTDPVVFIHDRLTLSLLTPQGLSPFGTLGKSNFGKAIASVGDSLAVAGSESIWLFTYYENQWIPWFSLPLPGISVISMSMLDDESTIMMLTEGGSIYQLPLSKMGITVDPISPVAMTQFGESLIQAKGGWGILSAKVTEVGQAPGLTATISVVKDGSFLLRVNSDAQNSYLQSSYVKVTLTDDVGESLTVTVSVVIEPNDFNNPATPLISPQKGDFNSDGVVDIRDAVLAVKVLAGATGLTIDLTQEVNGNGKIDLAEVLYALQVVAEKR